MLLFLFEKSPRHRDFLSGLAAPATAETIRITNAFVKFRFPKRPRDESCELCENSDEYNRIAKDPVKTVIRSQRVVICATVVTLLLSMYALSGHQIVAARNEASERYNNVNKRIEELQSHAADTGGVTVGQKFADYIKNHPDFQPVERKNPGDNFAFCDNFVTVSPLPKEEKLAFYGSALQFDVCQERLRARYQLFAVAGQLIAWQRTLTNPFQSLLGLHQLIPSQRNGIKSENKGFDSQPVASTPVAVTTPSAKSVNEKPNINSDSAAPTVVLNQSEQWCEIANFLENVAAAPSEIFGRSFAVAQEFSNKKTCTEFADGAEPGDLCAVRLAEKVEYFGTIPDSIISCLTLYILPCMYCFL